MNQETLTALAEVSQTTTMPLPAGRSYHRSSDASVESSGHSMSVRAHRSSESISSSISNQTTVPTGHRDVSRDAPSNRSHRLSANDLPDELLKSLGLGDASPTQGSHILSSIAASAVDMTPSSAGVGSASSTPAELSFGPQSVPFTLKRRELINEGTPSRPATAAPSYFQARDASQPVSSPPINQTARGPSEKKPLSTWRRTQILTAKRPELALNTVPQPIPTLYGPHSLPYARNPSGVDATVADETAYLTHVFGLRPATDGASDTKANESIRIISSGTDSSVTQSLRSTSTSSMYNASAAGKTTSEDIGRDDRYLVRPAKSLYQSVKGEKGSAADTTEVVVPFDFDTLQLGSPAGYRDMDPASDSANRSKNIILPSQDGKRVVSDSALLEPKLGTSILGPSKSFANLREASRLSPIPGSPADFTRTLEVASIRKAYKARIRSASMSRVEPAQLSTTTRPDDYASSFATPIRLPAFVPIYFDPASRTYGLGVPPETAKMPRLEEHEKSDRSNQNVPKDPQSQSPSVQVSKADISDNWRHKSRPTSAVRPKKLYTPVNSQPQTPSTGGFRSQSGSSSSEVMTIDKLFEKYSPQVSFATEGTASKDSSHASVEPAATSKAAHHVLTSITNADTAKPSREHRPSSPQNALGHRLAPAASILPKGTPGAGRLLKKSVKVKVDDDDDLPYVPREAKVAFSENRE
ncbi:hypothetical protein IAR50_003857 [Cryptococcus sp. DSM 104548]